MAASHHRVPVCKHDKEDTPETQFEVPTVPDAFLDAKEPFEAKPDEVCPNRTAMRSSIFFGHSSPPVSMPSMPQ